MSARCLPRWVFSHTCALCCCIHPINICQSVQGKPGYIPVLHKKYLPKSRKICSSCHFFPLPQIHLPVTFPPRWLLRSVKSVQGQWQEVSTVSRKSFDRAGQRAVFLVGVCCRPPSQDGEADEGFSKCLAAALGLPALVLVWGLTLVSLCWKLSAAGRQQPGMLLECVGENSPTPVVTEPSRAGGSSGGFINTPRTKGGPRKQSIPWCEPASSDSQAQLLQEWQRHKAVGLPGHSKVTNPFPLCLVWKGNEQVER